MASVRHRLHNYRPFLDRDGIETRWVPYLGDLRATRLGRVAEKVRFVWGLFRASPPVGSTVLIQKVLVPPMLIRRWQRRHVRVVYDFDDALFERAPWGERPAVTVRRRRRLISILELADAVVVGSPPLADFASRYVADVDVLYPSLDRARFEKDDRGEADSDSLRLGWIGGGGSQRYLLDLEPVLAEVLEMHPEACLIVCSSSLPAFRELPAERVQLIPWSLDSEVEASRLFDVAVSPMGSDSWSRHRGGRVSVLLSMATCTPVVAGPGGGLEELVEGVEGAIVFARSPQEWIDRLHVLLTDPSERRAKGALARRVVEEKIWAHVQYPRLKRALFGEEPEEERSGDQHG